MVLEIAKACPETEEKILESIVDKLCQLDVDLKHKLRKFQFSSLAKIQPMAQYLKELSIKIPSDKETKLGLLFDLLLDYIHGRIDQMQAKSIGSGGNRYASNGDDEFVEMLLNIFETKIFPIHKLNLMQYLPFYIVTLG
jgi:hypothetical protein